MLKKTITYTDFNGMERTEDFYFNLTQAECQEMNLSVSGGLEETIKSLINTHDNRRIVEIFKEFILRSYGQKSPDGRRFIKSKELSEEFSQTEAYSQLFMELASDAKLAADFFNQVIPNAKPSGAPAPLRPVN